MNALLHHLASLALALAAAAAPAPTLRYAGTLNDAQGRPLYGSFLLNFRIFDEAAGGRQSWMESRYVKVDGGRFTAQLGQRQPLPAAVLRGAYRLSVEAPPGTGWTAGAAAAPELAGAAQPDAPPEAPPGAAAAAPAGIGRLERELEAAKAEARRARVESEDSKRRLDALERGSKAPPEPEPGGTRIYTVREGDTLRSVAAKLLGDERHWVIIYAANSDRLHRAGEVMAGEKLVVPAAPR